IEFHLEALELRIDVAQVLRGVGGQEDKEIAIARLRAVEADPAVEATVGGAALGADLEGVGDLGIEQVVDAADAIRIGHCANTGLVETAAAEAAAPARIQRDGVGGLVTQCRLGLQLAPAVAAFLTARRG